MSLPSEMVIIFANIFQPFAKDYTPRPTKEIYYIREETLYT